MAEQTDKQTAAAIMQPSPALDALRRGSFNRLTVLPNVAELADLSMPSAAAAAPPLLPRRVGLCATANPRFMGLRLGAIEGVWSGVAEELPAARSVPGISVLRTR